jgi:hypothetical protein
MTPLIALLPYNAAAGPPHDFDAVDFL